jgi:hypothetical protein
MHRHGKGNNLLEVDHMKQTAKLGALIPTAALLYATGVFCPTHAAYAFEHRPERIIDGRGHILDSRYNHGHYYPAVGVSVRVLPEGYRPYFFGGHPYYFYAGVWYAPAGAGFVVVRPPVGVVISVLPPYYSTVWFGGAPYYYANDVYYTWDPTRNGYVVVEPPANAADPSSPPSTHEDLIIYPKNGQSAAQQAGDRYDCHSWAKAQTGFDPTQVGGGVPPGSAASGRSEYDRAMSACLTARGYEVR